jgi:hypothetical protein
MGPLGVDVAFGRTRAVLWSRECRHWKSGFGRRRREYTRMGLRADELLRVDQGQRGRRRCRWGRCSCVRGGRPCWSEEKKWMTLKIMYICLAFYPPTTMPHKIYTSLLPPLPIPSESVFTHLFTSNDPSLVGHFPASHPAYIDARTGTTITRGQVKQFALELGYSLRTSFGARRGDTVLVYSPNSIHWPVAIFGAGACSPLCTFEPRQRCIQSLPA